MNNPEWLRPQRWTARQRPIFERLASAKNDLVGTLQLILQTRRFTPKLLSLPGFGTLGVSDRRREVGIEYNYRREAATPEPLAGWLRRSTRETLSEDSTP
jgi:hypothetical protein